MRSVLRNNSKILLYCLAVFLINCAKPVRQVDLLARRQSPPDVLNLTRLGAYGPVFESGVTLIEPSGITVNRIGDIFVSDKGANAIYRLSSEFTMVGDEGGIGSSLGTFNRPLGMSCDPALNLYVADSGNKRIQIMDRRLRYGKTVDTYFDENDEPLKFTQPDDIDIDREGSIWIADNDKVLKLDPFYELLQEMSYNVSGDFRIGRASAIAISNLDLLAISDTGNRQIILATIHGNHITEFETEPASAVAWDNTGLLWVAVSEPGMLEAFDINGRIRYKFAENSPGYRPSALAFDMSGRLIVLDSKQRKIYVYDVVRGS